MLILWSDDLYDSGIRKSSYSMFLSKESTHLNGIKYSSNCSGNDTVVFLTDRQDISTCHRIRLSWTLVDIQIVGQIFEQFVSYCLSISKYRNIVSIENILQHRFHTCSIQFFLEMKDLNRIILIIELYLKSFRSKDEVIFKCSSFTKDNLVGLWMNGHATFLIMIFFSL